MLFICAAEMATLASKYPTQKTAVFASPHCVKEQFTHKMHLLVSGWPN